MLPLNSGDRYLGVWFGKNSYCFGWLMLVVLGSLYCSSFRVSNAQRWGISIFKGLLQRRYSHNVAAITWYKVIRKLHLLPKGCILRNSFLYLYKKIQKKYCFFYCDIQMNSLSHFSIQVYLLNVINIQYVKHKDS